MPRLTNKKQYKYGLLLFVIIGIISIVSLYYINNLLLIDAIVNINGILIVIIVISLRILLLSIISFYLFYKWFKQEAQYLTDIPFLLGLFFLILTFGKTIDLFWDLTYFAFSDDTVLLLLKIRYFIIVIDVAPLIYLGFEIIFFRLEDKYTKLRDKKFMNSLRTKIIVSIVVIESTAIILSPNIGVLGIFLPIFFIPSLIGIVYIFYLAYKLNRLKMVKPKILTIGFLLCVFTSIFRPIMQITLGETATYIIVVELVDLFVFLVIFMGLYKKTK